jgi:hypothetical protein
MNIKLHIDALVLQHIDLPGHGQAMLKRTVTTELARLIASDAAALHHWTTGAVPVLRAGPISLPPTACGADRAKRLGRSIARSVFQRIGS